MTALADDLVPDELWALVEPLLPVPPRPPYAGRRRAVSDRACFAAIVFMARTSTPWRLLPARELGCGSPATCWRRLTEWANAGVFDQLHLEVLDRLGEQGRLDWSRASVDTMSVRAKRGGTTWAQIHLDRGKPGTKLHLDRDGGGLPLTTAVTAANVADVTMLAAVVDDIPPVRTPSGRRRARPGSLHADKGYDGQANRAWLRRRDSATDCSAWGRVVGQVGTAPLAGGTVAVMVELLAAAAGAVGPRFGPVARVRAAGLRGRLLQPALTGQRERDVWATSRPASRKTASLSALAGRVPP